MPCMLFFANRWQPTGTKRIRLVPRSRCVNHGLCFNQGFSPIPVDHMQHERSIITAPIFHLVDVSPTDGNHSRIQVNVLPDFWQL